MKKEPWEDEIDHIVDDALNSMNFSELNNQVHNTANRVLEEVRKVVGSYQPVNQKNREPEKKAESSKHYAYDKVVKRNDSKPQTTAKKKEKVVGSVGSTLLIVFGSIGLGIFGIASFVTGLVGLATGLGVLGTVSGGLFVVFLGFGAMLGSGIHMKSRIKRYYEYKRILKDRTFCAIKEMSSFVGKSKRYVTKDLRMMIRMGYFVEGHIDDKKEYFMTSDEVYQQYLLSMKNYKQRKEEKIETKNTEKQPSKVDKNSDLYRTIKAGREHIVEIRQMNELIPSKKITASLDRLEEITSKIFVCVEKNPEKLPEIRKFMEYYLPTTLKLVKAYRDLDAQTIQGDNITSAKAEIEHTLDTINDAFEQLLDGLFEDVAMEVSTDISVLQTLLAQEGLMKSDFKQGGKQ